MLMDGWMDWINIHSAPGNIQGPQMKKILTSVVFSSCFLLYYIHCYIYYINSFHERSYAEQVNKILVPKISTV